MTRTHPKQTATEENLPNWLSEAHIFEVYAVIMSLWRKPNSGKCSLMRLNCGVLETIVGLDASCAAARPHSRHVSQRIPVFPGAARHKWAHSGPRLTHRNLNQEQHLSLTMACLFACSSVDDRVNWGLLSQGSYTVFSRPKVAPCYMVHCLFLIFFFLFFFIMCTGP